MKGDDKNWPAWFNGPKGESAVFGAPEDVPNGWTSGAEKRTVKGSKAPVEKPKVDDPAEIDAHGHAYDSALHAATQSKTKDGLWRMKVGVKRPDPAPGYPLPLDL